MEPSKASSGEELQVISRFESLRKILRSEEYADHLDKPLAYWVLPTDRRLPLAFLGRTLQNLLGTPFGELSQTPGIGRKKIRSLVHLLARAANTDPAELPDEEFCRPEVEVISPSGNGKTVAAEDTLGQGNGFDLASVSEVTWSCWRSSVVKHGLGDETLGRLAPSLQRMTRVIWNTPLKAYAHYTLREMRSMKTHGEKRVRAIVEVFHSADALVCGMGKQDHLIVRIMPRLIDRVEQWIGGALQAPGAGAEEEIFENFVGPLLEQVRIDATQQIAELAENRLGIDCPITSVRQAARTLGLTRARVYQLLNEINDILMVRWPNGRHQAYELREKFQSELAVMNDPPELKQFFAAIELFYPGCRRGAAGPLEQAPEQCDVNGRPLEARAG